MLAASKSSRRARSPWTIAALVTISVYSSAWRDSRRRKYRQWRSVHSIIGATQKRCVEGVQFPAAQTLDQFFRS